MNRPGQNGMWDEEDGFYYDLLRLPDGRGGVNCSFAFRTGSRCVAKERGTTYSCDGES